MNAVEQLFRDWNSGLVLLQTTHAGFAAQVDSVGGTTGDEATQLANMGVDLALISLYGTAYLKVHWEPKNIIDEMPRNENCPGSLKNGWWQRTLDQITGLTFHHTLSDSPHAFAKYYVKKDGGRPSTCYSIWITQTGEVLLCTALEEGCWHDHTGHKNVNLSVGLAGRLHEYRPAQVQLEAAARVVKWAVEHPKMSITMDQVLGHMDYIKTQCPGWDSAASDFWKDDFMALLAS